VPFTSPFTAIGLRPRQTAGPPNAVESSYRTAETPIRWIPGADARVIQVGQCAQRGPTYPNTPDNAIRKY
jgi:hypothetical protein